MEYKFLIKNRHVCSFYLFLFLIACGNNQPGLEKLPLDSTILAFGNSITYGTGASPQESYPARLQSLSGLKIINAGKPGEVSVDGLKRLAGQLNKTKPRLLILCHGGNDILRRKSLSQTKENILSMITMAKEKNIPVILLGMPEPGLFLNSADIYDEIASEIDVIYLPELIPEILSKPEYKSDPVHPNARGYMKMAEEIMSTLKTTGAI